MNESDSATPKSKGSSATDTRSANDCPDLKSALGRPLSRRLKRNRAALLAARELHLPWQRSLAGKLWQSFLSSQDASFLAKAPAAVTGVGNRECDSWWELKYWTFIASCFEQHQAYERLLRTYDDVEPLSAAASGVQARFFGSGHGRSTLNSYRCIGSSLGSGKAALRFEKVYSRDYDDFARVSSLDAYAGDRLRSGGVWMPPILEVVSGERVTLSYSALTSGKRVGLKAGLVRGAEVVNFLMALPVCESSLDPVMRRTHAGFRESYTVARNWVVARKPEYGDAIDTVARLIEQTYPRYLAHGDLHHKNMLSNGAVLDWDTCGVYPVGFDPGLILSRSVSARSVDELEVILKQHFVRDSFSRAVEPFMIHGALFHAFVFGAGKRSVLSTPLLGELLERVLSQVPGRIS